MTGSLCDPRVDPLLRARGIRNQVEALEYLRTVRDRQEVPADLAALLARLGLDTLIETLELAVGPIPGPSPERIFQDRPLGVPFDRRAPDGPDS